MLHFSPVQIMGKWSHRFFPAGLGNFGFVGSFLSVSVGTVSLLRVFLWDSSGSGFVRFRVQRVRNGSFLFGSS